MLDVRRRRVLGSAATAAVLLVALLVVLLITRDDPESEAAPAPVPAAPTPSPPMIEALPPSIDPACVGGATRPFEPTTITVAGVVRNAPLMAMPRDADNVPGVPPTNLKGTFGYDQPPGIRPGADRGNVLLNAHTWPDGSAAGNALLQELEVGGRIVLRGNGEKLCYDVTERVEVDVRDGYPPYYDTEGPPQVALIVCSGERRGPGDWTHRTIWFASPVTPVDEAS